MNHFPHLFFSILIFSQTKHSQSSCIPQERQALLVFKNSLIDLSNRLSSWAGSNCCTWLGVTCTNQTNHVTKLDLRNPVSRDIDGFIDHASNQLEGSINPSLIQLKYLSHLDLSWNNFNRTPLPYFFSTFSYLEYLNLSNTRFDGLVPHDIGNLSNLRVLDLSSSPINFDSQLIIDDMTWVYRLSSLQHLDLSWVNLTMSRNLSKVLYVFPSLVYLSLSSCGISNINLFANRFTNSTLEYLDLSVNSLQGLFPERIRDILRLRVLDLSSNYFNSTIPSWLTTMKGLVTVKLAFNRFFGELSGDFGYLTSLKILDLSFNSIGGEIPSSLWDLCELRVLDLTLNLFSGSMVLPSTTSTNCIKGKQLLKLGLRWNMLSGNFPDWVGQFQNLEYLDVANNSFSGPIPASIGNLSQLRVLDLSLNRFSGSIPQSLGQLSLLEKFLISSNFLVGNVSENHFVNLSNLRELDVSANYLTFEFSSNWTPQFQLKYINMKSCKIGPKFPQWLSMQKEIMALYLSNTSISDALPKWLPSLNFSYLDLSLNEIYGHIPTFSRPASLYMNLYLSYNKFDGVLPIFPSNVNRLDLTDNMISGPLPRNIGEMMPTLDNLLLSGNNINGSLPKSLCDLKVIRILDISSNNLSGEIPNCWHDFNILVVLDFSSNNLFGGIPSSIGSINSLKSLHLSHNSLGGPLPSTLENCTNLVILDIGDNRFSGTLPRYIGANMTKLEILGLSQNLFSGEIPLEFCNLIELQVLDLAENNFSGPIRACFGNFHGMFLGGQGTSNIGIFKWSTTYGETLVQVLKGIELEYTKTLRLVTNLDLSSNNFVGTIPEELTNLTGLRGLNFSRNRLTGNIPSRIGEMKVLESLDLSWNEFSGSIPISLGDLSSLSHLNFSYNELEGRIPSGNQLQTFADSAYLGNGGLCGFPLVKKCDVDETNEVEPPSDGDGKEMDWFVIAMSVGYVVGLWGVIAALFFITSWRIAYFEYVDHVWDWFVGDGGKRIKQEESVERSIGWST